MTGRQVARGLLLVAGTIGLGAVGSGVWDRLGDPVIDGLSRLTISTIDVAFGTYKDSVYREAALGFHEHSARELYKVVLLVLPATYFFVLLQHPWLRRRRRDRARSGKGGWARRFIRSRRGFYAVVGLTLSVFFLWIIETSRLDYSNRVVSSVEGSLARLAPFLTEQEEEELLAQFRAVGGSQDYYALHERITGLFVAHGLEYTEPDPL